MGYKYATKKQMDFLNWVYVNTDIDYPDKRMIDIADYYDGRYKPESPAQKRFNELRLQYLPSYVKSKIVTHQTNQS